MIAAQSIQTENDGQSVRLMANFTVNQWLTSWNWNNVPSGSEIEDGISDHKDEDKPDNSTPPAIIIIVTHTVSSLSQRLIQKPGVKATCRLACSGEQLIVPWMLPATGRWKTKKMAVYNLQD